MREWRAHCRKRKGPHVRSTSPCSATRPLASPTRGMLGVVSEAPSAHPSPDATGAPLSINLRLRTASCRRDGLQFQRFHRDVRGAAEVPYTENGLLVEVVASVDEMTSGVSAGAAGTARPPGVAPCGDENDAGSSPAVASSCCDGTTPRAMRMRQTDTIQQAPLTEWGPIRTPHGRLNAPYCGASTGATAAGAARWPSSAAVTDVGAAGAGASRSSSSSAAATSCDAGGRCRSRQMRPQSAAMRPLVRPRGSHYFTRTMPSRARNRFVLQCPRPELRWRHLARCTTSRQSNVYIVRSFASCLLF